MQQGKLERVSRLVGRPTVMTDETVAKLCMVLQRGFSIPAACNFALINRSTFYRHFNSNPTFASKVSSAIMFLYLASTEVVYNKIVNEKNVKLALWYLEKTDPDRFGNAKLCKYHRVLRQQYVNREVYFKAKSPYD